MVLLLKKLFTTYEYFWSFLTALEEKHKYALPLVEQMIRAIPDQRISLEKVKEMLEPLRTNKQTNAV